MSSKKKPACSESEKKKIKSWFIKAKILGASDVEIYLSSGERYTSIRYTSIDDLIWDENLKCPAVAMRDGGRLVPIFVYKNTRYGGLYVCPYYAENAIYVGEKDLEGDLRVL